MLRRAGLDRCAQLIVGSAPVDERLLASFRELGVEIHDAYGLTEAPLVALNRLGRNRIGTVGEPLPEDGDPGSPRRRGAGAGTPGDGRLRRRGRAAVP